MYLYLLRKTFLFLIALLVLTIISYSIARLDFHSDQSEFSFFIGWLNYLHLFFQGNLGIAQDGIPVMTHLAATFPATIELCVFAFFIAMIIGIPLGILAGVKRGHTTDSLIYSLTLLISSIPIFGISILLIMFFSNYFGDFPASNRYNLLLEIPAITGFTFVDIFLAKTPDPIAAIMNVLRHLMIPGLVLAIAPTTEIIKLLRDNVAEVMTQNYIKAAATKGLSLFQIIRHHVLKNTFPSVLSKFGLQLSTMMSLAIITESVFNWPGIGSWLLTSIELHDYTSVQAAVLVLGITVLMVSMVFDLLSIAMSPLIRRELYAAKQ